MNRENAIGLIFWACMCVIAGVIGYEIGKETGCTWKTPARIDALERRVAELERESIPIRTTTFPFMTDGVNHDRHYGVPNGLEVKP